MKMVAVTRSGKAKRGKGMERIASYRRVASLSYAT
jgi:hypothetical protein